MRFALTLTPITDDTPDAVDIEVAITESMSEVYLADGTPVQLFPRGAIVLERDALTAFLNAVNVGLGGVDDPEVAEVLATTLQTLEAEASHA